MAEGPLCNRHEIVKTGILSFRPKNQLIKKLKKHEATLYTNSSTGVARLELYENEKGRRDGTYNLLIPGSEVVSVKECLNAQSSSEKFGFMICTKEQQHTLYAKDKGDQNDWIQKTSCTLLQTHRNPEAMEVDGTVTLENDIYESAEDFVREYRVTPGAETRQTLGSDGEVRLVVENGHITIITLEGHRAARWGIEHLRRFGYRDTDFHIEAGRKSELGEGYFTFITKQGKQIHTIVTKEKTKCRQNKAAGTAGMKNKLHVGQVAIAADKIEIPLTMGGHIYEDVTVYNIEKPNKPTPEKPARQSHPKYVDASGATSAYSNRKTMSPQSSPTGGCTMSQINKVKSQPTHTGVPAATAQGPYQPATKVFPTLAQNTAPSLPPTNSLYSEPQQFTEAWKSYGRDSPEQDERIYENAVSEKEEEATYQRLHYLHETSRMPKPSVDRETMYGFLKDNNQLASGKVFEQQNDVQEAMETQPSPPQVQQSEPIYAVLDKSKKQKKKPEQ